MLLQLTMPVSRNLHALCGSLQKRSRLPRLCLARFRIGSTARSWPARARMELPKDRVWPLRLCDAQSQSVWRACLRQGFPLRGHQGNTSLSRTPATRPLPSSRRCRFPPRLGVPAAPKPSSVPDCRHNPLCGTFILEDARVFRGRPQRQNPRSRRAEVRFRGLEGSAPGSRRPLPTADRVPRRYAGTSRGAPGAARGSPRITVQSQCRELSGVCPSISL
jgi:hypothetical protein